MDRMMSRGTSFIMQRGFWLRCMAVLLLSAAVWVGYVQWKIAGVQKLQAVRPADVGIVLGAALWHDVPSPALMERLEHGAELYRSGRVRKLIVSGGFDGNGSTLTEAEGMRRYLIGIGIPDRDIATETASRNTYENLVNSQEIMTRENWRSAIIVTHHYHGARAADIADFIGMKDTALSTCDSKVLNRYWHRFRETLAFTKWEWEKLFLL
jgi:uncharacterized SAM-binding protein YcdF (DUF218 family)